MVEKNLYIIAGCNGAGKTTASFTILPEIIKCKEFVNADEIAKGLSPFQPEKVAFEAGRIMLNRIDELMRMGESFAFETTLSTRSYKQKILEVMTTVEEQIEFRDKILIGLEKAYEKLIEYKKQKKSVIVVLRDNKIVKIEPK